MASSNHSDEETPLLSDSTTQSPSILGDPSASAEATIIPDEPSTKRLVITLGAVWVGVFLGALDSTIIATLSASISTSFNSLSLLSWLASAYLIANAACQPLSGRLTDIFSRRTGLIVSNILFAAGNLICGLADSQWVMIFGRVVAGCGGGGLMAISTFVGSDLVPLRKRGVVQGIGNICYGTGAGLGGIFGGWINDNWGWRMAFLVQVPFIMVSGVVVACSVNIPPKKSEKSKLSRVDFLGSFTLVLTLVLLLLGLNSGGNIVPWNHPLVYVSLSLSLLSLLGFIYIELYIASEPVIPVRLLVNRTVLAACLTNWFVTMVIFMIIFYVPLYYQVRGVSTTASGMRLIPQSIGASIGSLGSGIIMNRTGKYKATSLITLTMIVIGTGLLVTLNPNTPDWPIYIYLSLTGIGYGAILTTTLLAIISAVSHDHHSVITSASYAFRSTGSTIGITVASAVYQNILKTQLWEKFGDQPNAEEIIKKIRDSFDELNNLPEGWKEGVMESYMDSFRGVFLTALGFAVLMAGVGSMMKQNVLHERLDRS
ncbi:d5007ee9-1eb8-4c23-99aa-e4c3dc648eeb [Sclerotinia trifoliorum]|uniref:D5007ee9-1eb8-4c23-99aa-e4c3dc648eeb n=1 Tax=Sclerotinia trifoliorum TaxID=28548 RepID=A0A8H2VMF8_9HELO|nr:d5007ee9-1eb8-4c23-99aa-e4c3dc648eeb [Sclerotinia trifoliorum]